MKKRILNSLLIACIVTSVIVGTFGIVQYIKDNDEIANIFCTIALAPGAFATYIIATRALGKSALGKKLIAYIAGPLLALVGGFIIGRSNILAGILFGITIMSVLLISTNPPRSNATKSQVLFAVFFVLSSSAALGYITYVGLRTEPVTALLTFTVPEKIRAGLGLIVGLAPFLVGVREIMKIMKRLKNEQGSHDSPNK